MTRKQIADARAIADIVCVQNHYNVARRDDDALIDELAAAGIAYVPFFPLGGFTPLQSTALNESPSGSARRRCDGARRLLQRAPNILLILAPHRSSICGKTWRRPTGVAARGGDRAGSDRDRQGASLTLLPKTKGKSGGLNPETNPSEGGLQAA